MDVESYLRVCDQFRLGDLITESPHPETTGLAEMAQSRLSDALDAFHRVDMLAMEGVIKGLQPLQQLVRSIRVALDAGGRIYIAGCGATGRLALSLETFAREAWLDESEMDRVVSFMAGGDAALIRSIESFEDFPEYGARQLMELGFGETDLMIAITEGGETPWVIGACLKAASISRHDSWFLFCNPPELLRERAKRCEEILDASNVRKFFINTGPMALAGSTRLQATTAQMLIAGAALREAMGKGSAINLIQSFRDMLDDFNYRFLAPFIEAEANAIQAGDRVLYQTDRYGMTVLTDTTERAPTFSISPFENKDRPQEPVSWCYLCLPGSSDADSAWKQILGRNPRTLEWGEFRERASRDTLMGYDISAHAPEWRACRHPGNRQLAFDIYGEEIVLEFAGLRHSLDAAGLSVLLKNLLLKVSLNAHSTLVMGRLERFESNLMTCVKPSNNKLIDRAARYVQHFHRQTTGEQLPYEIAVRKVFDSFK